MEIEYAILSREVVPNYSITYTYDYSGSTRFIRATVRLRGWGLLAVIRGADTRTAYKRAHSLVRRYARHNTI